jgi:hypothetical protein
MAERILITGARAPAALDIARSFAAAGFEVHMADCAPCWMARAARAPKAVHRYPSPVADPTGFTRSVSALVDHINPVVIIPACEEVFHLAQQPNLAGRLFAPPLAVLDRLHAKSAFAADCKALGLPSPETSRVEDAAQLFTFASRSRDFVFKPDYSRFGTQTLIGPPPDVLAWIEPTSTAPWTVQQLIRGTEVSFYAAAVNSQLAVFSAYRSTWRLGGGAAYAFQPLDADISARLRAIAETLATQRVHSGQFACDAIVDASGQPWLIECNPRATSGTHLFARCPEFALALIGRAPPCDARTALHGHIGPALWWYGMPDAIAHNRLSEWRAQRSLGHDVTGAPGDRAPVLGAMADTLVFGLRALAHGRSLSEEMTADIEWNGDLP